MSSTRMPAQSGDPISSALHLSLSAAKKCKGGEDLDSRIIASAKQILFSEIKYEKTKCFNTSMLSELKSKYIVLNTVVQTSTKSEEVTNVKEHRVVCEVSTKKVVPALKEPTSLPTPKRILYSPDAVRLGWTGQVPVGSGFVNLGNTCYLNSSLQALFHVPAFVNWLLADTNHSSKCESLNGMTHSECLICAMSKTLQSSQKCTGSVVKPLQIYSKLKLICKHLVHGHQEDAHEFLRYLIEGMERSYLTIFNGIKLDSYSKETTPLNQIFGGYLRSEVTCLDCGHVSTTFQHFQDLLLDIRTASSVDDALDCYFSREQLGDGDQAYRCEQCKRRVAATKKFTIERPPKALCIALKRFGAMGGKNNKTISIKQILDVSKFRHRPHAEPLLYKLVSLVSHLGPSESCGHYTAVGQAASGTYYLFDDNMVKPLPLQNVLNSNPYILLYEMETATQKLPPTPKKEVVANGFTNSSSSNGFSNSNVETKTNTVNNNSTASFSNESASTSSELRPGQNGLSLQCPNKPFKIVYFGKPRVDSQAGPSKPTVEEQSNQAKQQDSSQQIKARIASFQRKEQMSLTMDKPPAPVSDKATPKKADLPPSSLIKHQTQESSSSEKPRATGSRDNSLSKIPLPSTPEKKTEDKMFSSSEDEHKSSPGLRLVPYLAESSESESEFVPPKPSPSKDPPKPSAKSSGRSSPTVHKAKGVRIEIEGWESTSTSQLGCNRTELHSPAGSTSSGKWSVTSAERDKTPEKQEKSNSTPVEKCESNDRIPNGSSSGVKSERWDGSRGSNSTMEHLLKTSHRGYGNQVKSWNGGRSEMDVQVEGERNYLKRCHDSYNDDFDRGKVKKVKKYHNKESNGNGRNRFQEFQNRKNMWQSSQRQKYYRDYTLENRSKPRYYFSRGQRFWD